MWFKGIQCFPAALLLLSVGGGVTTLRQRDINIYTERERRRRESTGLIVHCSHRDMMKHWGESEQHSTHTEREREIKEMSLYHPPASLTLFSPALSFSLFSRPWVAVGVSFAFVQHISTCCSMIWSNRSPCRRWKLINDTLIPLFYLSFERL